MAGRYPGTERATNLRGLQRPAAGRAAAIAFHQLAQGQTKGAFHQAALADVTGQLERHGAQRAAHAEVAIERGALGHDDGYRGQGEYVVHQRRQAEQALQRRQRGLGADDAALAFYGFEQCGFFAADIGTGAHPHFQVKGLAAAGHVAAEVAGVTGDGESLVEHADGIGVFRAHIDVALVGTHGEAGNDHAFDQQERVAFHQHAVGEGTGVTFVGVAHHVLLACSGVTHGAPLDAGRERRTAAATQAGIEHGGDHLGTVQGHGRLKAGETTMGTVVVQRQWAGDAGAGEQQALLGLEVRDVLDRPQGQ